MIGLARSLGRLLACSGLAVASFSAAAQEWPIKGPVRLIVAALPGSSPDLTARLLAQELNKQTGAAFVVINKAGGLGIPALTDVSQAKNDGTTLLIGNINTNGLAPALHAKKYGYDPKMALEPVTLLSDGPSALIASKTAPAGDFREQVKAWRANPGKYAYFGAGAGGFTHIWFLKLTDAQKDLNLLFVPVKGGADGFQLMQEGSVHYSYVPIASFIGQMRTKEIRTLFVTGPARLDEFPDVPTAKEMGLSEDFEINTWVGLFAPPKTSPELLGRIHAAFVAAVKRPEMATKYKEAYMLQTVSASPQEFRKFVDGQIETYRLLAERTKVKVD
jgi:tripartite-type tricarboxylate transporter receptor subunit TctC